MPIAKARPMVRKLPKAARTGASVSFPAARVKDAIAAMPGYTVRERQQRTATVGPLKAKAELLDVP